MKRKILSALTALCLMLTLLPATVLAEEGKADVAAIGENQYETLAAAVAEAKDGDTIKLLGESTLSTDVEFHSDNLILDMAGQTLMTAGFSLHVVSGGLTITGNGKMINDVAGAEKSNPEGNSKTIFYPKTMLKVDAGAKLTVEDGTYDTKAVQIIYTSGDVLVKNGTFTCSYQDAQGLYDGKCIMVAVGGDATLTIEDGSLEAIYGTDYSGMNGVYARDGATIVLGVEGREGGPSIHTNYSAIGSNNTTATSNITIYGGTYSIDTDGDTSSEKANKFNTVVYLACEGVYNISGGTFETKGENSHVFSMPYTKPDITLNVSGGKFLATGELFFVGDDDNCQGSNTGDHLSITGGTFSDSSILNYLGSGADITVALAADATKSITIPESATVTLDLNGHTLSGAAASHTITNNGKLTVLDSGSKGELKGDNAGFSAIQNNPGAVAVIKSGKISKGNNVNDNDYYVITNHGKMTIEGGNIISQSSHSSAIENGWYTASQNTAQVDAELTITGGSVSAPNASGGLYTLKNDDYGVMDISGGTFQNATAGAGTVLNWNELTISGGTFTASNASVATMAVGTADGPEYTYEKGTTSISDGTFIGFLGTHEDYAAAITVSVSGGTFSVDPSAYVAEGYIATADGKLFAVKEKESTAAEVAPAEPKVEVGKDVPAEIKDTVETAVKNVTASGLTGAAGSVANDNTVTEDAGRAALEAEHVTVDSTETVSIYVQPYMDIQITGAEVKEDKITTLTLEITPMVRTVATTATDPEQIELGKDGQNAVVVSPAKELTVNTPVTISIPLPDVYETTGGIQIKHVKENGRVYYYDATVAEVEGKEIASFTVTNGFSTFTLEAKDTRKATVTFDADGGSEVANAAYTITNVGDALPTSSRSGYTFTGWTFEGLTGTYTTLPDLWAVVEADGDFEVKATAQFSRNGSSSNYTLTFEVNGGTAISRISRSRGTTIDLSDYRTTRKGYTFAGWYSDSKLTKAVTSIKLTANTTVYAKWTEVDANPFDDVSASAYYYDAVLWAVEHDITQGTGADTFAPNAACTRAQVVTFLWRANGSPAPKSVANPFTDVADNAYYHDAVLWAVEQGITTGTSATTFSPDAACTRAQVVTFLWRAESKPAASGVSFTDVAADAYYAGAVAWAVAKDVTNGTSATTFSPDAACTRGQIVTFLYRATER